MIDRQFLRNLRPEIESALKEIGERHNISLALGNASFTSNNATFKLEIATVGDNGEVNSKEVNHFKSFAASYGLSPDDLGKEISMGGKRFIITGLNTNAPKNPIKMEEVGTGRKYKSPIGPVKAALAIATL